MSCGQPGLSQVEMLGELARGGEGQAGHQDAPLQPPHSLSWRCCRVTCCLALWLWRIHGWKTSKAPRSVQKGRANQPASLSPSLSSAKCSLRLSPATSGTFPGPQAPLRAALGRGRRQRGRSWALMGSLKALLKPAAIPYCSAWGRRSQQLLLLAWGQDLS